MGVSGVVVDEPGSPSEGGVETWAPGIKEPSVTARLGGLKLLSPSLSLATVLTGAFPPLRAALRAMKAVPAETDLCGMADFSNCDEVPLAGLPLLLHD